MIFTASEVAMIEALQNGQQVELTFAEWPRCREIMVRMRDEAQRYRDNPRSEKEYQVAGMRLWYVTTALNKHDEEVAKRPTAEPMEIICRTVGHGFIGSRPSTATTIDARLTL